MKRNDPPSGGGSARHSNVTNHNNTDGTSHNYASHDHSRGPPVATIRRSNNAVASDHQQHHRSSYESQPRRFRDRSRSRSPDIPYHRDPHYNDNNNHHEHHTRPSRYNHDNNVNNTNSLSLNMDHHHNHRSSPPPPPHHIGNSKPPPTRAIVMDDPVEQERRARMARLRAENEEEERRLAVVESRGKMNSSDPFLSLDGSSIDHLGDPKSKVIQVNLDDLDGLTEEEQMKKLLGFGDFATTKGQAVADNQTSAARGAAAKNKARKYRQYMNRKGGFNRPLDKVD